MLHSRTAKTDGGTRTSPMGTEISCAHCLEDFLFKKNKNKIAVLFVRLLCVLTFQAVPLHTAWWHAAIPRTKKNLFCLNWLNE